VIESNSAPGTPAEDEMLMMVKFWAGVGHEITLTFLFFQILDIWAEELPSPGTVGEGPAPLIVKNRLRNLAYDYHMPYSNPTKHGYFVPMQTYFWDDPKKYI
jgi:hypothetical protein